MKITRIRVLLFFMAVFLVGAIISLLIGKPYLAATELLAALFFCMCIAGSVTEIARELLTELEAEGHDFDLIDFRRTEEELLRLADAWSIVHHYGEKCEWEWADLSQDDAIRMMSVLSAAVDGEQGCQDDAEFEEQRRKSLAEYRVAHPVIAQRAPEDGEATKGGAAAE